VQWGCQSCWMQFNNSARCGLGVGVEAFVAGARCSATTCRCVFACWLRLVVTAPSLSSHASCVSLCACILPSPAGCVASFPLGLGALRAGALGSAPYRPPGRICSCLAAAPC
jgi:hypothetical protein